MPELPDIVVYLDALRPRVVDRPLKALTHDDVSIYPAWSPDGTRIAFARSTPEDDDIVVMNADGSGATPLTSKATSFFLESHPTWSPDGEWIAFGAFDGDDEIFIMKADGSGQANLTNNANDINDLYPAWCPSGDRPGERLAKDASSGNVVINDLSSPTADPASLARSLVGPGIPVSNVRLSGPDISAGTFTLGTAPLGIEEGIVLSSGKATSAHGPNVSDSATEVLGTRGDTNLTALSGHPTFDATVLEFQFVPDVDTIEFQYVFGSDEYNEFGNTKYNDIFALEVNGQNCATIGNPPVPVSINNVSGGNPFGSEPRSHPDQ